MPRLFIFVRNSDPLAQNDIPEAATLRRVWDAVPRKGERLLFDSANLLVEEVQHDFQNEEINIETEKVPPAQIQSLIEDGWNEG